MIKELFSLLRVNGEWTYKNGPSYCTSHINSVGKHYPDYEYNRNTGIFYPTSKESDIQNLVMTVGHETICANCGHTFDDSARRLVHYRRDECTI